MVYVLIKRIPYGGDSFLGVYSSKKKAKEMLEKGDYYLRSNGSFYIVSVNMNDEAKHYISNLDGEELYK
jgi:hypothetical protein